MAADGRMTGGTLPLPAPLPEEESQEQRRSDRDAPRDPSATGSHGYGTTFTCVDPTYRAPS